MKLATFNVNGINARLPRLLEWLDGAAMDVVCLQEIKCTDENFPTAAIEGRGYHVMTHGQKGFNGVAILSRFPLNDAVCGLPGDGDDPQARWLEVTVLGVRVVCLYVPNGNPQPGPKFEYKCAWMRRCIARAQALLAQEQPLVLAGDYNVCPTDEDVFDRAAMADDALVHPESRRLWRHLLYLGFWDALRAQQPSGKAYTYWDYRAGAWPRDLGLRIDHILLSCRAADRLEACGVDRAPRGLECASDHTPVWVALRG